MASQDITFCLNRKCEMKECERHPSNIRNTRPFYSFAELDGTKHCLKRDLKQKTKQVGPIIGLRRERW